MMQRLGLEEDEQEAIEMTSAHVNL